MDKESKPKLLLHCCCAGCAVYVIKLLREKFDVTAYFYNPNIWPEKEYDKRLEEMKRICQEVGVPLIIGEYETKKWFEKIKGHENDKEGGERCEMCYWLRLDKTAELAKKDKFSYFAATLSISPHKKAEKINRPGLDLGQKYGIIFYEADFKKQDGFKKSLALSQHYNLYRQNYCGCEYSKKARKPASPSQGGQESKKACLVGRQAIKQ